MLFSIPASRCIPRREKCSPAGCPPRQIFSQRTGRSHNKQIIIPQMAKSKPTREQIEFEQMLEGYRIQLRNERLMADMNKATFEKMHYFVEASKLMPEYDRIRELEEKKRQENIKKADEAVEQLKAAVQNGELN